MGVNPIDTPSETRNALAPLQENAEQPGVCARELHAFLGVKQNRTDWIKYQIQRVELIENKDFGIFPLKGENPKGGSPGTSCILSTKTKTLRFTLIL